jgi:hypothetical protein
VILLFVFLSGHRPWKADGNDDRSFIEGLLSEKGKQRRRDVKGSSRCVCVCVQKQDARWSVLHAPVKAVL